MAVGYGIYCKKCSYTSTSVFRVSPDILYNFNISPKNALEKVIKSTSGNEKKMIQQIISRRKNVENFSEGHSIFQCSKCCAIVNKFHIELMENDQKLYETKVVCDNCNIDMQRLKYISRDNIIIGIKCPKCKSEDVDVGEKISWD